MEIFGGRGEPSSGIGSLVQSNEMMANPMKNVDRGCDDSLHIFPCSFYFLLQSIFTSSQALIIITSDTLLYVRLSCKPVYVIAFIRISILTFQLLPYSCILTSLSINPICCLRTESGTVESLSF